MHTKLMASAALAAALISAPALAQTATAPGNYVQLNVGSGVAGQAKVDATVNGLGNESADADLNAGLFLSAAAGHAFGNGLSLEAEAIYAHNKADNDDIYALTGYRDDTTARTWGGMINAKYELPTGWRNISPYVGAGAGYGNVRINVSDVGHDDQSGFMWQAKAGLSYPMSDKVTWDLGYRYLRAPDYDSSATALGYTGQASIDTHIHVVSLGARLKF